MNFSCQWLLSWKHSGKKVVSFSQRRKVRRVGYYKGKQDLRGDSALLREYRKATLSNYVTPTQALTLSLFANLVVLCEPSAFSASRREI